MLLVKFLHLVSLYHSFLYSSWNIPYVQKSPCLTKGCVTPRYVSIPLGVHVSKEYSYESSTTDPEKLFPAWCSQLSLCVFCVLIFVRGGISTLFFLMKMASSIPP